MAEVVIPFQQATENLSDSPSSVKEPEFVQIHNCVPDVETGDIALRPDLKTSDYLAGVDAMYGAGYDALVGLAWVPATGAFCNVMASGPRDQVGAHLGALESIRGEIRGAIFRAGECIADRVRPGYFAKIPGEARLFEVVAMASLSACQFDAEPFAQGNVTIDFVAGFGKSASKHGIATDVIGGTLIIGPASPLAAKPTRFNGPLIASVEPDSVGRFQSWPTLITPHWPDGFAPASCVGFALAHAGLGYGLLMATDDGEIFRSVDGGFNWESLATFSQTIRFFGQLGGYVVCVTDEAIFTTTDLSAWSEAYRWDASWQFVDAASSWEAQGSTPRLAVLLEFDSDGQYGLQVVVIDGTLNTSTRSAFNDQSTSAVGICPGNRAIQIEWSGTDFDDQQYILTELGEVYRLSAADQLENAAIGSFTGKRKASRPFDAAGVVFDEVSVANATSNLPIMMTTTNGGVGVIVRGLSTDYWDSVTSWTRPGIHIIRSDNGVATVLPEVSYSAIPVPKQFRIYYLGVSTRIWVDEFGQLLLQGERCCTETGNSSESTISVIQGVAVVSDRGAAHSDGFVPNRAGRAAAHLPSGTVVDSDGFICKAEGSGRLGLPIAPTSIIAAGRITPSGGEEAIIVADGQGFVWDGASVAPYSDATFDSYQKVAAFSLGTGLTAAGFTTYAFVTQAPLGVLYGSPSSGWTFAPSSLSGTYLSSLAEGLHLYLVSDAGAEEWDFAMTPPTVSSATPPGILLPIVGAGFATIQPTATNEFFAVGSDGIAIAKLGDVLGYCPSVVNAGIDEYGNAVLVGGGLPSPTSISSGNFVSHYIATAGSSDATDRTVCIGGLPFDSAAPGRLVVSDHGQPRGTSAAVSGSIVAWSHTDGEIGVLNFSTSQRSRVLTVPSPVIGCAIGNGRVVVLDTTGQVLSLAPGDTTPTVAGTVSGQPLRTTGGPNVAFAVGSLSCLILGPTGTLSLALDGATDAAGSMDLCSIAMSDVLRIVDDGGNVIDYPLNEMAGLSSGAVVPVASLRAPMVLRSSGVSRRRTADLTYQLVAYRNGTWIPVGTIDAGESARAFAAHGRITTVVSKSTGVVIRDYSSWGGGFFAPPSANFWSPVWATADGMLVLFGVTEIEDGKLVHYRRRVRWSAPLAPADFDTLEASGLADLYPDTGEFLAAVGLSHAIIYADEAGLGVIEATGAPEAPWSHRRIAEGVVPITPMVRVGNSAVFIGRDNALWVVNQAGASRVVNAYPSTVLARAVEETPGLASIPQLGWVVSWVPGTRFLFISQQRDGRTTSWSISPTSDAPVTFHAVCDGQAVGKSMLISGSWASPLEVNVIEPSDTSTGVDTILGTEMPWYAIIVTGAIIQSEQPASYMASIHGNDALDKLAVWAEATPASSFPQLVYPVRCSFDARLDASAPVWNVWSSAENSGVLRLWSPWYSTTILGADGSQVPFTPVDDYTVSVAAGQTVFVWPAKRYKSAQWAVFEYSDRVILPIGVSSPINPWQLYGVDYPWLTQGSTVHAVPLESASHGPTVAVNGIPAFGRAHCLTLILRPESAVTRCVISRVVLTSPSVPLGQFGVVSTPTG